MKFGLKYILLAFLIITGCTF